MRSCNFMIKAKCVTTYHNKRSTGVPQRCPGLCIIFSKCKETFLLGTNEHSYKRFWLVQRSRYLSKDLTSQSKSTVKKWKWNRQAAEVESKVTKKNSHQERDQATAICDSINWRTHTRAHTIIGSTLISEPKPSLFLSIHSPQASILPASSALIDL